MIGHAAGLRRLDGIIWAIIAVLSAIMLAAPVVSNFQLVGHSFLAAGGATTLSLAGFWLYETRRPDPRLASALGGTAQIVTFAAVGAPVSYMGAQGIITFPSLHAALVLIVTVALWPIPVLRWLGLAINTLMLVSIPVDGGHYFIDVLAGLAIAWASLLAAKRIAEFAHQPQLQTANSGVGFIPG